MCKKKLHVQMNALCKMKHKQTKKPHTFQNYDSSHKVHGSFLVILDLKNESRKAFAPEHPFDCDMLGF